VQHVPLCRFHHRLKTVGGWTVRFTTAEQPYPPGTVEWTSKFGQHLVDLPPTLPGSNTWTPPPRPEKVTDQTGNQPSTPTPEDVTGPDTDESWYPANATTEERQAQRTWLWTYQLNKINKADETTARNPRTPPEPPPPPDYGEPPF
jgi:hypothetical protein